MSAVFRVQRPASTWPPRGPLTPMAALIQTLQEMETAYNEWKYNTLTTGRQEGLVQALDVLCDALDIELREQERAELLTWDVERLKQAIVSVHTSRHLPIN